jgi:hypothetical protein
MPSKGSVSLTGQPENQAVVTSKGLCQQERGADALVLVFMIEDREEDAVHRGAV